MDGYAVRAADTTGASAESPVRLRGDRRAAGRPRPRPSVGAGEAIRIMTGAPMPAGAGRGRDGRAHTPATAPTAVLHRRRPRRPGDHVRPAGGDLDAGDVGVPGRHRADAPRISACWPASASAQVRVTPPGPGRGALDRRRARRRDGAAARAGPDPRLEPADAARPGRRGRLRCRSTSGSLADDEAGIPAALDGRDAPTCDALLTSGGVSMGDYDYVKVALDRARRRCATSARSRSSRPSRWRSASSRGAGACPCSGCPATRCRRW